MTEETFIRDMTRICGAKAANYFGTQWLKQFRADPATASLVLEKVKAILRRTEVTRPAALFHVLFWKERKKS